MTPLRSVLPAGVEATDYWPLTNGAAQARDDGSIALFEQPWSGRSRWSRCTGHRCWRWRWPGTPRWAASADTDGVVHLWDVDPASGRWTARETLIGHEGPVRGLEIDALRQTG